MNLRYSSFFLASLLMLSGCGGSSDNDSNEVNSPSNPVLPSPTEPTPEPVSNEVFGFGFNGVSDLGNIYEVDAVIQRLVVDNSGEYWLINNNTIDSQGDQLDPLPSTIIYGLSHGNFSKDSVDNAYISTGTDFSFFENTRRKFDINAKSVANKALNLTYKVNEGNTTTINNKATLARKSLPSKESISDQIGQTTGAFAGTFGVSLGTYTVNANSTFSIVDSRQCLIQGTLDNDTDSKFTVVNATIDARASRCPLEGGQASGIRLIDEEGGTILLTTPNDNNGYIFNYS